ncbi:mono/diheme cytochrome c family protein [Flavobacterium sp. HSC-32F16]|uniref:c-type cytochrome n=1 Tax=Flavobacterium sp. HSC-32F16 TaxID=2910964 RepID=UPI0020A2CC89|nr:c-type cytochrome [Flavobacterium sp. HSC-32F16]MCP2028426.1 mono/diheme cytochrome c family protein [Flavobacterium sp. HSC-32F16]
MKKLFLATMFALFLFVSCGKEKSNTDQDFSTPSATETAAEPDSYDPNRGLGKYSTVELGASLDKALAEKGLKTAEVKCTSCHKATDEKLVGPGWKGVTGRRTPQWIMNFITNPDPMIDKDPELQAQLELCLIRMPNQGLTDDEARSVLEYMRQNDGVK